MPRHLDMLDPEDEPLVVAVDHARWCRAQGMTPEGVFVALGRPIAAGYGPTWREATWALCWEHRKILTKIEARERESLLRKQAITRSMRRAA